MSQYQIRQAFGFRGRAYKQGEIVEFEDDLARAYGPDYMVPAPKSVEDIVANKQVTDADTRTASVEATAEPEPAVEPETTPEPEPEPAEKPKKKGRK